jgi:CRISPR-associated protein Cmr5
MQTRNQRLAADVFSKVSEFKGRFTDENGKVKREHEPEVKLYGSLAHRLPVLIRQAGLAQALAFVEARGRTTQMDLLTHLSLTVKGIEDALLTRSREAKLSEYVQLTRETLAALTWYKRFAQSVLEVEAGEDISAETLGDEAKGVQI